jgi:hypothetical protein
MKKEIHGNTAGIREIVLNEMLGLYDLSMAADEFLSNEACDQLVRFTSLINREVLVYVSRAGTVEDVRVGDDHSVHMEEMRLVRNIDRLSGVRCIHTHPNETGYLSDVDLGSLNALRLDAMCAIGVKDGRASSVIRRVHRRHGKRGARTRLVWADARAPSAAKTADGRDSGSGQTALSDTYNIVEIKPDRAVLAGIESSDGYDTLSELRGPLRNGGDQGRRKRTAAKARSGRLPLYRLRQGGGTRADGFRLRGGYLRVRRRAQRHSASKP